MSLARAASLETAGRGLLVVSDLHLGKRSPFGFPVDLERALADAIRSAAQRGTVIVLNGDIIEDGEGVSPFAAIARYPRLLQALGEATLLSSVYYVAGNHDPPAARLIDVLPWNVVPSLVVDDTVLVIHGDSFDAGLRESAVGRASRMHAALQEVVGTRIDLPLATNDSFRNRLVIGVCSRLGQVARRSHKSVEQWVDTNFDYLVSLENGTDPRFVLASLADAVLPPRIKTVLAGHTHFPGVADVGVITYFNSGTWSDHMATAIEWRDGNGRVFDVIRGTEHGRDAYANWAEREGWVAWWARARHDLSPERVIATEVRKRLENRPQTPVRPALDSTSSIGEGMHVTFEEKLRGTFHATSGAEHPVDLVLQGTTRPDFARSCLVDLAGTIDAEHFATKKEALGVLKLGARTWDYEVSFVADDGRPHRFVGHKRVRVMDLAASLTDLRGDVTDPHGRRVASAELTFDLARDLGPLIRSLTTGAPLPVEARATVEPISDPLEMDRRDDVNGRWVAITGAAGHVGFTLAKQLALRGYSVLGLVRDAKDERASRLRALGVEVVEADMMSPRTLRAAFEGKTVDGLFHTAAPFKLWSRDAEREIVRPMVQGTLNVLAAAEHAGIRRTILTSAGGAAGHDARGRDPLTEADWNQTRESPYLRGKTLAEERAWEFAEQRGLDLLTLLPSAILGPWFHNHTPITRLFEDVVDGRLPLLPDFANSWVDVRDVARAHILVYEAPHSRGRYICSALYQSWHVLAARLAVVDPKIRVPRKLPDAMIPLLPVVDDLRARFSGSERSMTRAIVDELRNKEPRYSSDRLRRETGWAPIDFDRTLVDTVRWLAERRGKPAPAMRA